MDVGQIVTTLGVSVSSGIAIISYFLVKRDKTLDEHTKEITDMRIAHGVMKAELADLQRRADRTSDRVTRASFTNEAE